MGEDGGDHLLEAPGEAGFVLRGGVGADGAHENRLGVDDLAGAVVDADGGAGVPAGEADIGLDGGLVAQEPRAVEAAAGDAPEAFVDGGAGDVGEDQSDDAEMLLLLAVAQGHLDLAPAGNLLAVEGFEPMGGHEPGAGDGGAAVGRHLDDLPVADGIESPFDGAEKLGQFVVEGDGFDGVDVGGMLVHGWFLSLLGWRDSSLKSQVDSR